MFDKFNSHDDMAKVDVKVHVLHLSYQKVVLMKYFEFMLSTLASTSPMRKHMEGHGASAIRKEDGARGRT